MDLNYELKILKSEKDKIELSYKELKEEQTNMKSTNYDLDKKFGTQVSQIYEKDQKLTEYENTTKTLKVLVDEKIIKINEFAKSKKYLENCCSDMQNTID